MEEINKLTPVQQAVEILNGIAIFTDSDKMLKTANSIVDKAIEITCKEIPVISRIGSMKAHTGVKAKITKSQYWLDVKDEINKLYK